jgi:NitT/TauT family transport system permease protein
MKKLFFTFLSLSVFFGLWQLGYIYFGELVLPDVAATFKTAFLFAADPEVLEHLGLTLKRVLSGLGSVIVLATLAGMLAGGIKSLEYMCAPIITIMLGMPSIAWIVLAMIWFGMGNATVVFVIFIALFPIIFLGAFQGVKTIDKKLLLMADSFNIPLKQKIFHIYLPHLFSYVFPSWLTAVGLSWKIVIMAELMSSDDGMGSLLAIARSQLDTTSVMAILLLMVSILVIIERVFLEPAKKRIDNWRD